MRSRQSHIWILKATLFLLPLFFLPPVADSFEFAKLALLAVGVLLGFLFWSAGKIRREFSLRTSPLDSAVLGFAAVVFLGGFFITPNGVDAFFFPGTATLILAGTFLYFLVVQTHNPQLTTQPTTHGSLLTPFLAGGALSALVSALAGVGAFKLIPGAPVWLAQETFTTTGGLLPSITLFIVLLPLAVDRLLQGKRAGEQESRSLNLTLLYSFTLILLVAGLATTAFHALPGKATAPRLLPFSTGWSIALEVFKKSPILGVGPGNFVEAFNRFRPIEFNTSEVWNLRFASSSNWPLHVFTVTGLLGFSVFAFLLWRLWKKVYSTGNWKLATGKLTPTHYSLLASILLLFLFPANLLLLVAFYLLLGIVASPKAREVKLVLGVGDSVSQGHRANILPVALSLVVAGIAVFVLYFGGKVYAADISYARALEAAARNDGVGSYNALIEAINRNPRRDAYRVTSSQVNLALANSIASNAQQQAGEGGEISEQDRQTISQLVQQAIREAKAAVALNQRRSVNWENLARIYQALIPFAQGADQWTTSAYQQAVALDPVNPALRIAFGGVFYSLGQYEDAIRVFELAVAAKPDFANAHYNLAAALREKGDTERAIAEMEQVLRLVEQGTQDYGLAQGELEALRGKLAEEREATASGETLEVSQTPTEPVLQPPLELEGAAPPATAPASPIPAPQISPTPAQRPSPSPTQPAQ